MTTDKTLERVREALRPNLGIVIETFEIGTESEYEEAVLCMVNSAVAAHLAALAEDVSDVMHEAFHQRYLEIVGSPPASIAVRRAISAALAAARKE